MPPESRTTNTTFECIAGEMSDVKAILRKGRASDHCLWLKQEMAALRSQMSGQINVEVDARPAIDLNAVISEVREQYENTARKNQKDLEAWFQKKVRSTDELAAMTAGKCILQ